MEEFVHARLLELKAQAKQKAPADSLVGDVNSEDGGHEAEDADGSDEPEDGD